MNAHYVRKSAKDLNRYQRSVILGIALREVDDLPTRAKHLKKLAYCTDEAKFEVLKESDTVSEGLYDSLYELYFGTVQEDEPEPEPAPEPVQDFERYGEEDIMEEPTSKATRRREGHHKSKWTDERCIRLIEEYKKGLSTKVLGKLFGVSHVAARQKIAKLKKDERFRGLFADEPTQEDPPAEPITAPPKSHLPKAFTATGTGLLTVGDGLKLDGEPLLTMLRQEIIKRGVEQFYADVEIVIRPSSPAGMVVTTEEEE
ncbi:MAG: hypothetical protein VZR73_00480 [Acutalibacteraceae bacterium]|nr:hypothetical protein [Acutalibacteraceae bacterium]